MLQSVQAGQQDLWQTLTVPEIRIYESVGSHLQAFRMAVAASLQNCRCARLISGQPAFASNAAGRENENTSKVTSRVSGSQATVNRSSPDTGYSGRVP